MVPISGGFVMDEHEAGIATGYLNGDTVIPMHYDSMESLPDVDLDKFRECIDQHASSAEALVLDRGESVEL